VKKTINGHAYDFQPLPYDVGLVVAAEIGGALLPSLGALAEGPVALWVAGELDVSDLMDMDVGQALKGVKPSEIANAMAASLRRGDLRPEAMRQALSTTTRDGVLLAGPAFDQAFRGAMAESFVAAFHAIQANGLFTWPSTDDGPAVAGN
jgi:hypothetical protein